MYIFFWIEIEEFQISKATSIFWYQFFHPIGNFVSIWESSHCNSYKLFNKWFIRKLWYSAFVTFGNFLILLLQLLGWKKCIFCISQGKSLKFSHTILIPTSWLKLPKLQESTIVLTLTAIIVFIYVLSQAYKASQFPKFTGKFFLPYVAQEKKVDKSKRFN